MPIDVIPLTKPKLMLKLHQKLDMEDPNVIRDLCSLNTGQSTRYDQFWEECDKYLNENTAINDRRHSTVAHLALALSV